MIALVILIVGILIVVIPAVWPFACRLISISAESSQGF
jgi:hypothetical protein